MARSKKGAMKKSESKHRPPTAAKSKRGTKRKSESNQMSEQQGSKRQKKFAEWSTDELNEWLENRDLGDLCTPFKEQGIAPDVIPTLTSSDLKEIGTENFGLRKRFANAVKAEKNEHWLISSAESLSTRIPVLERKMSRRIISDDTVGRIVAMNNALTRQLSSSGLHDEDVEEEASDAEATVGCCAHFLILLAEGLCAHLINSMIIPLFQPPMPTSFLEQDDFIATNVFLNHMMKSVALTSIIVAFNQVLRLHFRCEVRNE
eukprot:jgi/Bigna1/87961/estExt_fgenesh1_pg.C_260103